MALIELSSGFINTGRSGGGYIQRLINGLSGQESIYNIGLFTLGTTGGSADIFIMKGTMPTDFSGLTLTNSRSSDILVSFSGRSFNIVIPTYTNPVQFSTNYVNAGASGTATWFWARSCPALGPFGSPSAIQQQFIGTVGTQGSGADMEINSTNVVAGSAYRVISSQITLPTSWTY